jgi:hypothetical protein
MYPLKPGTVVLAVAPTTALYAVQQGDVPLHVLDRLHAGLADSVHNLVDKVPLTLVDKVKHLPL